MKKISLVVAILLSLATTCGVKHIALAQSAPQNNQPAAQKALPPLSKADLYLLLERHVSSVDILVELSFRGMEIPMDSEILQELEAKGADRLLLNKVSEFFVGDLQARRDLSVFMNEERFQRVIEHADVLIERSPRLLPALEARAISRLALKDAAAAESDLRKILEYSPEHSSAQYVLAKALELSHREDEAIELLSEVINRLSISAFQVRAKCYLLRGQLSVKKGNHRQAADDFQRALVYSPGDFQLWDDAAQLFARSGDPGVRSPVAAKEFATALQLAAGDDARRARAQLRLAEAAASSGDFKQAKMHLDLTNAFALTEEIKAQVSKLREQIEAANFTTWRPTSLEMQVDVDAAASIRSQLAKAEPTEGAKESSLLISARPINQKEWAEVMGASRPAAPQSPQEEISWHEAQSFIAKLNALSEVHGVRYRLPRRAELQSARKPKESKDSATAQAPTLASPKIAVWCEDKYLPIGAPDAADTPFRVVLSKPSSPSTSIGPNDSALEFAPAAASWKGVGIQLVAEALAETERERFKSAPGRWGFARSIDLASRHKEWDPISWTTINTDSQPLLQVELFIRLKEGDFPGAISSARRLIQESDATNARRADFARCLLVVFAAKHAADAQDKDMQRELEEAVDLVRGKHRSHGYWFAEYARAVLLRSQQNWQEAQVSAERALSQSPVPMHDKCRELLELTKASNATAVVPHPTLLESLSDNLFFPPANP